MCLVSCDTFVVLGDVTQTGEVIFGKNSDRPAGEVQEVVYVPGQTHAAGETSVARIRTIFGQKMYYKNFYSACSGPKIIQPCF
jgi:hypothetical protein